MNKFFFSQTKSLLRYLEFHNAIDSDYYNKVVKNLSHHQSDHTNKYVYKHLLNILKDKPYLKTFDDEYNYYYIDFVNLQKKKYNID